MIRRFRDLSRQSISEKHTGINGPIWRNWPSCPDHRPALCLDVVIFHCGHLPLCACGAQGTSIFRLCVVGRKTPVCFHPDRQNRGVVLKGHINTTSEDSEWLYMSCKSKEITYLDLVQNDFW